MGIIVSRVRQLRKEGKTISEACELAGEEAGKDARTVYQLVRRLEPSTEIAELYLKSSALRLAMRIVRDANVPEAIDILSRKNIGVIAPKAEQMGGAGGFFLSVTAETCGAVKVQAAVLPQESPAESTIDCNDYSVAALPPVTEEETAHEPVRRQHQGRIRGADGLSPRQKRSIEVAKERINRARAQHLIDRQRRIRLGEQIEGETDQDASGGAE